MRAKACRRLKPQFEHVGKRPLRVALISPKGPLYRHRGGIWKKALRYQPLTLTTLAALIPEDVHAEVRLFDEGICDVPSDLEADLEFSGQDAVDLRDDLVPASESDRTAYFKEWLSNRRSGAWPRPTPRC